MRLMIFLLLLVCAAACVKPVPQSTTWLPASEQGNPGVAASEISQPVGLAILPPTRIPGSPILTPTPDQPRTLPALRTEEEQYTIQSGDTLGKIAQRYGIDLDTLAKVNQIENINIVSVGQVLVIPAPEPQPAGPDFKIIPDSELVFGPASITLDLFSFIEQSGGYLSQYREDIDGQSYQGTEIINRIMREYSVNPRLLLAVLEYQSGWITQSNPSETDYPLGYADPGRKGLYRQLAWAANNLNRGYYLWKANAISHWLLPDNSIVPPSPTINAGTAGIQYLMSLLYDKAGWEQAVGEQGVFRVYSRLFGYPFDYAIEGLVPANLTQPAMILPFEPGQTWSFTGGPHGGWGDGSAWAAIDFAPPGEGLGCVASDAWVTAVADGLVIRSGDGVVVLDLDGDGYEQTGWTILYLHIATEQRVMVNSQIQSGDYIGHPSCEGGMSNGTHVHMARRYNGEWIPADGTLPFNLEGWISQGTGVEYDGTLTRDGEIVEAWDRFVPENQITR